jgi:hypothetical protein
MDNEIKCVICLDIIKNDDNIKELDCNHKFHQICFENFCKINGQHEIILCPLCRNNITNPYYGKMNIIFDYPSQINYRGIYFDDIKENTKCIFATFGLYSFYSFGFYLFYKMTEKILK